MHDQLEIEVRETGEEAPVIALTGRLDAAGAQSLRERCLELRTRGRRRVIVSLADVGFVASSGFGSFLLLSEEFRDAGGTVVFAAPSENVLRVIRLLNLEQFLEMADDVDAARALLESRLTPA